MQQLQHPVAIWFLRSENHDAGVRAGRVCSDIGEIKVEGDADPVLGPTSVADYRIRRAPQGLVVDRVTVMTHATEYATSFNGQVLVYLATHGASSSRQGNDSLLREVRGVAQRGWDRICRKAWIAVANFLGRQSGRKVREDNGDWNTSAADAGLAMADGRVNGDVVLPPHTEAPGWGPQR